MSRRTRQATIDRTEPAPRTRRRTSSAAQQGVAKPVHGVEGGWTTVSTGAVANWTALLRWGAWLLLMAGPLLGLAAFLYVPTVRVPPPVSTPVAASVADTAGPAGWAQLYVAAYLEAGRGTEASLSPYFPLVRDISLEAPPRAQIADRLAAVRVTEVSSGYWSVTVAAHVTSPGKAAAKSTPETEASAVATLRYFQVPVYAVAGGGFTATALPAEVAAPATGTGPEVGYGAPVPADGHDAAVAAVSEFLSAYLTGSADLDRYLSPGTDLNAVSPPPYKQVEVTQLAEKDGAFIANAAATEGERRELLVDVVATDRSGQGRPLTYALALKARDGRWEIAALEAAPGLNPPLKEKQ